MSQLDLFYQAFLAYKKHTKANLECKKLHTVSAGLNKMDQQSLSAIFTTCTIEEDWIEAIERGIPFIVKAIKEERQFIRNDGEVTPIEKVKKTSKDSIQDLAKHSNYISHEAPEGLNVDVLPDKLLITRKENDYTVYENRVIYATLLYLQEFISFRLNKIKEATNKYEANAKLNKKIIIGNRTLNYNLDFNEIIKEDPIASRKNNYLELIKRIEIIYSDVLSLLRMPLIVEVSKVDIVTRPITKTNVLKMDINFKETLSLFDFISEYDRDGFEVHVVEKSFNPLNLDIVHDYTEIMMLTSFVTYMHANVLETELENNYKQYLLEQKDIEEQNILERVKKLEIKANLDGKTLNEYLIIISEANKILQEKNELLNKKILDLQSDHKKEIQNINLLNDENIRVINEKHYSEISTLQDKHEDEINELNSSHNEAMSNLRTELNDTKTSLENEIATLKADYENKIKELNETHNREYKELREQKEKTESELIALKLEHGLTLDPMDFTSQKTFESLQREKSYMDEFYKKAWKATKKSIKKEIFSVKPQKPKKKEKVNKEKEE